LWHRYPQDLPALALKHGFTRKQIAFALILLATVQNPLAAPSIPELAAELAVCERTIYRWLAQFKALGLFTWIERPGLVNVYIPGKPFRCRREPMTQENVRGSSPPSLYGFKEHYSGHRKRQSGPWYVPLPPDPAMACPGPVENWTPCTDLPPDECPKCNDTGNLGGEKPCDCPSGADFRRRMRAKIL